MGKPSKQERDRQARVAALQAQQRRAERRRQVAIIGSAVLLAAALVGTAGFAVVREQQQEQAAGTAAEEPIKGVRDFPGLERNHVETAVDYPQTPPVGGNHAPVWTNCATYDTPVDSSQSVHSLEHGAVWITYRPGLPAEQVKTLTDLAAGNGFVLVSPFPELPAPVVASAWGKQLRVKSAADPRLAVFVQAFAQSPKAPEPGAPCTGGAGGM